MTKIQIVVYQLGNIDTYIENIKKALKSIRSELLF